MAAPEQDSHDAREAFVVELARDLNLDIDECRRRVEAEFLARDKLVSELAYVLGIDTEESWRRVAELDAAEVEEWREDCAGIERDVRWLEMRAHAAARRPRRPVPSSRSRMRSRESHRGRPGHRRSRSTRAGPSDDDGGPEPPPPRLALAPKPGAIYTYGALALDRDLWREIQ